MMARPAAIMTRKMAKRARACPQGQERAAAGGASQSRSLRERIPSRQHSRRDRDDDLKHRGQDRPQQELGVVQRRVGQDVFVPRERAGVVPAAPAAEGGSGAVAAETAACELDEAALPGVKYCLLKRIRSAAGGD